MSVHRLQSEVHLRGFWILEILFTCLLILPLFLLFDPLIFVLITCLSVASRDNLSTLYFSVPDVSHVSRLIMNLSDSGCRVILDDDSSSVQNRHTRALVGAGPWCRDS
jgi:hypothetical protein